MYPARDYRSLTLAIALFAFVMTLLAAGCTPKPPSIVGKWTRTAKSRSGLVTLTYDFAANGAVTVTEASGGVTTMVTGTYTFKDGTLTQKYISAVVRMTGSSPQTVVPTDPRPFNAAIDGDTLTIGTGAGAPFKRVVDKSGTGV